MPSTQSVPYPIRTLDDAPEASKPWLRRIQQSVGAIPNLAGAMASSPVLIEAFVGVREAFHRSSFSGLEKEVLALANAVENGCRYCQAIHATFAQKAGLPIEDVERIRTGQAPADARLATLAAFSRAMIRAKGHPPVAELERFRAAGFEAPQVLEVIVGIATSTLANYSGHVIAPQPDEGIRAQYR